MSTLETVQSILDLPRFQSLLRRYVVQGIRNAHPSIVCEGQVEATEWNYALLCASALTSAEVEAANEAVLRVAHACLVAVDATEEQRRSALLLLEREGNQPAIDLAVSRGIADPPDSEGLPLSLALDAARRRRELTLVSEDGRETAVNSFQKAFWDAASHHDWVSISAPTSAGKSHIVRMWISDLVTREPKCKIIYLAPTRALVEEVGLTFRRELGQDVPVHTLPWNSAESNEDKSVHVLTQERLHILLDSDPAFKPDFLFIDEAQKIGEGARGVLLTQVLDECAQRNSAAQFIFASPMTENPEILISSVPERARTTAVIGESVTVTQNLIYVNQVRGKPKKYALLASYKGAEEEVGVVQLEYAPSTSQRVPFLAVELGRFEGGNLIYANGPAQAESYAGHIFRALGDTSGAISEELKDLIDFAKGTVHDKFLLSQYLERGVAFHYGDMPLVLKSKIEELFKQGHIRFLVCTSTLLEGVNLPCKNIFVRNPKKGSNTQDMSLSDFWNLAGRAGRWGKEFQGNIFCVDTEKPQAWREVPRERIRLPIRRAVDHTLSNAAGVLDYVRSGALKAYDSNSAEMESVVSLVASSFVRGRTLSQMVGVEAPAEMRDEIDASIRTLMGTLSISDSLVSRHAGISPASMQRFQDAVTLSPDLEDLALVHPHSDNAARAYADALGLVDEHLGGSFHPESRRHSLARLIVNWMKGIPLSSIIEGKAKWRRSRGQDVNYPSLIRQVMGEVEDIVRFEAPKFLACYGDIIADTAAQRGVVLEEPLEDVRLMLEMGVPRRTEMSLIGIGLSRASTMAISPLLLEPSLSEEECLSWLSSHDFSAEDLPSFVRTEIESLLSQLGAAIVDSAD